MDTISQMKLFMEPRSVALVGVRGDTGPGSRNTLQNMLNQGYRGRVYPVNPKFQEILGIKTYPSVKDLPEVPDLAVLLTPRQIVPQLVKEATEGGIKALIVVAQGFADSNEEGQRLQKEIVAIARGAGARIVGPNSFGVANAFLDLNTAFAATGMQKIAIGTICQTGFTFPGLPRLTILGKALDLGNTCDIGFSEGLEYFEKDKDVKVIVLYVEGMRDGRRFMEVAKKVVRSKPVLALKAGRSAYGRESARSHSGSLAGEDHVYDAAFKQCGILRVEDTEELVDLCRTFLAFPHLKGNRLAIVTLSMGVGTIASDACERYGICLATFSENTIEKLQRLASSWLRVGNPVDLGGLSFGSEGPTEAFAASIEAALEDPNTDALLTIWHAHELTYARQSYPDIARGLADKHRDKPVALWLYGPEGSGKVAADFERNGNILNYPSPERAVRALSRLAQYLAYVAQPD